MKKAPKPPGFDKFETLFRAVIAVPKADVEKEEAKERIKNQKRRARNKTAKSKRASTSPPRQRP